MAAQFCEWSNTCCNIHSFVHVLIVVIVVIVVCDVVIHDIIVYYPVKPYIKEFFSVIYQISLTTVLISTYQSYDDK